MYLIWLIGLLFDLTFARKRETDEFFMHRAWEEGRMSDEEYRRRGGYVARRYVAERQDRWGKVPRAPAAVGFRSRPFS